MLPELGLQPPLQGISGVTIERGAVHRLPLRHRLLYRRQLLRCHVLALDGKQPCGCFLLRRTKVPPLLTALGGCTTGVLRSYASTGATVSFTTLGTWCEVHPLGRVHLPGCWGRREDLGGSCGLLQRGSSTSSCPCGTPGVGDVRGAGDVPDYVLPPNFLPRFNGCSLHQPPLRRQHIRAQQELVCTVVHLHAHPLQRQLQHVMHLQHHVGHPR